MKINFPLIPQNLIMKNGLLLDETIQAILESKVTFEQMQKENKKINLLEDKAHDYVGASQRKFVAEVTNWGVPRAERLAEGYEIGSLNDAGIGTFDAFRDAAAKYWTIEEETKGTSLEFINKSFGASIDLGIPFDMFVGGSIYNPIPAHNSNPYFEVDQTVILWASKKQFEQDYVVPGSEWVYPTYMPHLWKKYIGGNADPESPDYDPMKGVIKEFVDYEYFVFNVPTLLNKNKTDGLVIGGQQYASVRPEYNFYIRSYERTMHPIPTPGINERNLPNLYALLLQKNNQKNNPHFQQHITLGGALDFNKTPSPTSPADLTGSPPKNIKNHGIQYFAEWGRAAEKVGDGLVDVTASGNKFKNMILPHASVPSLKEYSDRKELFPMFVDLEVSMDKTAALSDLLKEMGLLDKFVLEVAKNVTLNSGYEIQTFEEATETAILPDDAAEGTVVKHVASTQRENKVWSVTKWLEKIAMVNLETGMYNPVGSTDEEIEALKQIIVMDDGTIEASQTVAPENKFYQSLMGVIFLEKLKGFMKDKFQTYRELMKGRSNHSETILYRIEKWKVDETGDPLGEVLQNFWFPNISEQDVAKIVDTQVKYGERYKYIVYAYQAVVKSSYSYENLTVGDSAAIFTVHQQPELILVEQQVYEDTHIMMDSAPVPPDLQIIPYFADSHNLLLNMNASVGEYLLQPISIYPEDEETIHKLREAQKIDPSAPLLYKNDDALGDNGYFEVYRLNYQPTNWYDFASGLVGRMRPPDGRLKASSASVKDSIHENQKYYYMIRMIDGHGHHSNPSPIYEVELVNDNGAVYFNKQVVDFATKEPKHPSKPMRRLIQIKPAFNQHFADVDEDLPSAFDVSNFDIGDAISPFGKKYKIRFVSKKTGRKFDVNVRVKKKIEKGIQ